MERDGAGPSLHTRIAAALARGAQAQKESRELVELMVDLRGRLRDTCTEVRDKREERRNARERA
jgi:hypothetical protein